MNKYLWSYALWIALTSCIYALLYLLSPLGSYGLMWMTFVALPIFFTAGAKPKEIPNYFCSMIAGLLWGLINLWFINLLMEYGVSAPAANAADLFIITLPCVGIHMTLLGKTWFNKVPMIFGGLSMTFSQGGQNMAVIGITLTCGILMAAVFSTGGAWLEKRMLTHD